MTKRDAQRCISMLTTLLLVLMHDPLLLMIAARLKRWRCQYVDHCIFLPDWINSTFEWLAMKRWALRFFNTTSKSKFSLIYWDQSTYTTWIGTKLCTDIHVPLGMSCNNNFCVHLHFSSSAIIVSTYHSVWYFGLWTKNHKSYLIYVNLKCSFVFSANLQVLAC